MANFPSFVKGRETGWIYDLVTEIYLDGAVYHTVQHNGTYNILFVRNNFREEEMKAKKKMRIAPAVLLPCTEQGELIPREECLNLWPWMELIKYVEPVTPSTHQKSQ